MAHPHKRAGELFGAPWPEKCIFKTGESVRVILGVGDHGAWHMSVGAWMLMSADAWVEQSWVG